MPSEGLILGSSGKWTDRVACIVSMQPAEQGKQLNIASFYIGLGTALMVAGIVYLSALLCPKEL